MCTVCNGIKVFLVSFLCLVLCLKLCLQLDKDGCCCSNGEWQAYTPYCTVGREAHNLYRVIYSIISPRFIAMVLAHIFHSYHVTLNGCFSHCTKLHCRRNMERLSFNSKILVKQILLWRVKHLLRLLLKSECGVVEGI